MAQQQDIVKRLEEIGNSPDRRVTEYFRWSNDKLYLEVSVDATGGISYSTNMTSIGKGMNWPTMDERYEADLKAALEALYA